MSLRYLLDTNICIYIAKAKPPTVLERFQQCQSGEIGMSVVTYGELYFGAAKSQQREAALSRLDALRTYIPVLPLTDKAGTAYGRCRAILERQGQPIGNNDLWIAAHAFSLDVILVSNNLREFERLPELRLENWA
jgi:tRNA(fMet)-specific endonuclease VapC